MTKATTYVAPNKGDIAMLRWIIGRHHLSTPDAEIEALVRDKLEIAEKKGIRPKAGERTRKAWVRAGLKLHHENRKLFTRFRL